MIPPRAGPLRILVASAQPAGFGRLSVEQELEVIRRGFDPLIDAGLAEVEVLPRATPSSIHARPVDGQLHHRALHRPWSVRRQDAGRLLWSSRMTRGGEYPLGERSVREIFCQRGVTLVFLNACQTGSGGRADFNKGVAQSLVAHGLPALVANQYSVLDSSATQLRAALLLGAGAGHDDRPGGARSAHRRQLLAAGRDDRLGRAGGLRARSEHDAVGLSPQGSPNCPAGRARSAVARPGPVGVAVWDIDNVFPSIKDTLERMTGAQERSRLRAGGPFRSDRCVGPGERADDGTPYLWAEKLANRLGRMPLELHVNVLACITRHWLRDDETLNLYGWWPTRANRRS